MNRSIYYADPAPSDLYKSNPRPGRICGTAPATLLLLWITIASLALVGCTSSQKSKDDEDAARTGLLEPPPDKSPVNQPPGVCHFDNNHTFAPEQGVAYLHRGRTFVFCCRECLDSFLVQQRP